MRGIVKPDPASLGVLWDYVEVVAVITLVTAIGWFTQLDYHAFGYIYLLVVIALSGSLWVMYHLNENMMPSSMPDMRNMP